MKEKTARKILVLFGIINPVLYIINPILILLGIGSEVLILLKTKNKINLKFWEIYLLLSTYFGVSILGIKIYDLAMIIMIPIVILKFKIKLNKEKMGFIVLILIYAIYLTMILLINNISNNQISEFMRYILAFILIIICLSTISNFEKIKKIFKFIISLAIKNIITGILIALFSINGMINYAFKNGFMSVNIHDISTEFRITGFFSDPNKYFMFFVFLLIVYEIYLYKMKEKKILTKMNIILIAPIILSLSRTALFVVILFIILKMINVKIIKYNRKIILISDIILMIIITLSITVFWKDLINFLDWSLIQITELLNRENSLRYSSSILKSSRVSSSILAINSTVDNIFLGNGFAYWHNIYYMPPHNTMVSILQDTGMIGVFIFMIVNIYALRKIPLYIILPLYIIPLMTFDLQNYRILYLVLSIIIVSNKVNKEEKR